MDDSSIELMKLAQEYYDYFLIGRGGEEWSQFGHFVSNDAWLRTCEGYFGLYVPRHEEYILREIHDYNLGLQAAHLIPLLGWMSRYEVSSRVLRTALRGEHHAIHAVSLHMLLPLMVAIPDFPRTLTVRDLIYFSREKDYNCVYRALRLLRYLPLSYPEFTELANAKTVFQHLYAESMHIGVGKYALDITNRIAEGYPS